MRLGQAAANTQTLWQKNFETQGGTETFMWVPERDEEGKTTQHVMYVLNELMQGNVTGEKGHRWLGWAQGWLCAHGCLTLEDCKYANVLS